MISSVVHTLVNQEAPAGWPKCPKCGRPLVSYQQRDSVNARFSLNTQEIFGYCCKCGSCHIELAQKGNVWQVIRYRFFILKPLPWQNINELPVPAVAIGPEIELVKG